MRELKITKSITNREASSFDKYLQEIAKEEMVSIEEEVLLAQRIHQGDKNALDKLCKANLRFVVSVAKQYQNQGVSLPDLINEGNLGLIKASQRFDETRGFKFISYAVWWIRQSILKAIADHSRIVHIPLNKQARLSKVKKSFSRLEQEYERDPSFQEIADDLELEEEDVSIVLGIKSNEKDVSMDATVLGPEFETNFLDTFISKEEPTDFLLIQASLKEEIRRALNTLSKPEKEVIELSFGLGGLASMTLDEIGCYLNLTRERVRQIKEKAIRRLKSTKRSKILKTYLG